jgi:hypothetical protein
VDFFAADLAFGAGLPAAFFLAAMKFHLRSSLFHALCVKKIFKIRDKHFPVVCMYLFLFAQNCNQKHQKLCCSLQTISA